MRCFKVLGNKYLQNYRSTYFLLFSKNTNMLPRTPKISYRDLKSGIEEFHTQCVLVPDKADKAANKVVVV